MQIADRLSKIPPYLFMELRKKINKAKADGVDVISLAIGDPVEPTPNGVIDELCRTAKIPKTTVTPRTRKRACMPSGRPWPSGTRSATASP